MGPKQTLTLRFRVDLGVIASDSVQHYIPLWVGSLASPHGIQSRYSKPSRQNEYSVSECAYLKLSKRNHFYIWEQKAVSFTNKQNYTKTARLHSSICY